MSKAIFERHLKPKHQYIVLTGNIHIVNVEKFLWDHQPTLSQAR